MSGLKNKNGFEFFAAANSGKGFISFFDKIFGSEKISRRYLIKGGPGTGKSSFMRRVADVAKLGGARVDYYYCSSDPSSLDGIIIDGSIALIDSTAPHSLEPDIVGARDNIVDLGAFWSENLLAEKYEQIKAYTEKKKRAYRLAYRFLSASMQCDIASREAFLPYVNFARLERVARRLTRKIKRGAGYKLTIGLRSALGMAGKRTLESYERTSEQIFYIEDHYGLGFALLSRICEFAMRNENKISVSYVPLCPDLPDAVYFEEEKLAFVVCGTEKKKRVSLRRALDLSGLSQKEKRALRERARSAKKLSEALVVSACDELALAGDAHFELEKIYRSAMDFPALDAFFAEFIKKI